MISPERFTAWAAAFIAAGTIWYQFFWKRLIVPVRTFLREEAKVRSDMQTEQKRQGDELADQSSILQRVQKEMMFNGGESMKDEVRQNSRDVRVLKHFMWMADSRARAEWRYKTAFNSVGAKELRWYCNRVTGRFTDLTGLTAEKCDNDGWLDAIAPSHRHEAMEQVERCQRSNAIFSMHYPLKSDGQRVYHRAEPIFERDGSVFSWVVEITLDAVKEERRHAVVAA